MSNEDNKVEEIKDPQTISANITPEMKEKFRDWWRGNDYRTEAEAIRALVKKAIEE